MNKIARGPHLGNPEHHVRGLLLLLGCLLIKSMLFLSFWIESVSSVHINCVSHYFYELTFIFFIGICCRKVGYFVLTTSNMYMTELANSIKHLNFYAVRFSHVSPIEDCLQNCECLSWFRPKLWNMMGIAGNVLPHQIWRHHHSYIPCENLYVSFISNLLMSHGNWARQG